RLRLLPSRVGGLLRPGPGALPRPGLRPGVGQAHRGAAGAAGASAPAALGTRFGRAAPPPRAGSVPGFLRGAGGAAGSTAHSWGALPVLADRGLRRMRFGTGSRPAPPARVAG